MTERCPVIPVEPPTPRQKAIIVFLVVIAVAAALLGCCPRYQQRRPLEERVDCLYHARFDFGLTEDERQFLEKSCEAVYQMRLRGGRPQ